MAVANLYDDAPLQLPLPLDPWAGGALDATVDDPEVLPALPGGPSQALPILAAPMSSDRLEAARQLARDNPGAVANIVRNWVSKEAAA